MPTPGGSLVGDGSDILMFCATNLGNDTAGFWFRGFDGSDLSVTPKHAITGIDIVELLPVDPYGQVDEEPAELIFGFIARQAFTADYAVGGPSELFAADYTGFIDGPADDFNGTWPALNGTATGLSWAILEISFHGDRRACTRAILKRPGPCLNGLKSCRL